MSKSERYTRIKNQIKELVVDVDNPITRMSTINALLYHKMADFFWTGFYLLNGNDLIVGPYQGPLACIKLAKNQGVCWAGVNERKSVLVGNVDEYPGHIACSDLSRSEIVVPVMNQDAKIVGVLDIDSKRLNTFDEIDRLHLEDIVHLIYHG